VECAENGLVASLKVGQVQAGGSLGGGGEPQFHARVQVVDPPSCPADEAAAKHDVRVAVEDGFDQPWNFPWVVLEIGVLHDHHLAGRGGESAAQRCALPLVPLLEEHLEAVLVYPVCTLEAAEPPLGGAAREPP